MTTTLYRKHRPQLLGDILGQDHVTSILSRAIETNTVAHAYIFAGPRGTGKTSVARIVAKALNCLQRSQSLENLPCNTCDNCRAIDQGALLDVLELDAASNRGIDEIRSLKEQVAISPLQGQCKVYILDEVHMLTNEAFNALLKTLEEPPKHVVFVLCTTELHKVPVTISSRCQRFTFFRANAEDLRKQLKSLAEAEKIAIEEDALGLLAQQADGGYRDAAMLLEQIATSRADTNQEQGIISATFIEQQLGLPNHELRRQLVDALIAGQPDKAIVQIEKFVSEGGNIHSLTLDLTNQLRLILLAIVSPEAAKNVVDITTVKQLQEVGRKTSPHQLAEIVKKLLQVQHQRHAYPALALELVFVENIAGQPHIVEKKGTAIAPQVATQTAKSQPSTKLPTPPEVIEAKVAAEPDSPAAVIEEVVVEQAPVLEAGNPSMQVNAAEGLDAMTLQQSWQKILDAVRPRTRSVEAILRDCTPLSFDGTILLLQFWYAFHQKQLDVDKNRRLVEEIASTILGTPVKIKTQLGDKNKRPKKRPMTEEDLQNVAPVQEEEELLDAAVEIFGGEFVD